MDDLLVQYERDRDAEYRRYSDSLPAVRISAWSPRRTLARDAERARSVADHMRRWGIQWWNSRGFRVIVGPDGEAFEAIERQ